MKKDTISKVNYENNFICKECSNIPLLGLKFVCEPKKISDILKVYSYCIFNDKNNKDEVKELNLTNISNQKDNRDEEIKCENCKKYSIDYTCLKCKKSLCEKCRSYHESHKLYNNKEILLSKEEFEKINNNYIKSKRVINENLSKIEKKINNYKEQINELEKCYQEYKNINYKLIEITEFILEKYNNLYKSNRPIYYPIYFNIKNVLRFNYNEIELSKELSISEDLDSLIKIINLGNNFLLKPSHLSENLNKYNKFQEIINIGAIDFEEFKELELDYIQTISYDKERILGIKNNENNDVLEVYNIINKKVETSIKLNSEDTKYNILYKNNMILIMNSTNIYILDPNKFIIIQEIKLKDKIQIEKGKSRSMWRRGYIDSYTEGQKHFHQFTFIDVFEKNSIGIIYEGNLDYLNKEKSYGELIKNDGTDIINKEYENFDISYSENFIYLLIYVKNEKNIFNIERIIVLLRKHIGVNEVPFTSYKHFEVEDTYPYCTFYFNSLNRISNDEFIIGFKSRLVAKRDQYNYYITDNIYKNETIYYRLNISKNEIENELFATTNDSLLLKDKNKFYFFINKSEENEVNLLKNVIKDNSELIEIICEDKPYFKKFLSDNGDIMGWGDKSIYFGKIYLNKFQIINTIIKNDKNITLVTLNPNFIIYKSKEKNNESDEETSEENNNFSENEDAEDNTD